MRTIQTLIALFSLLPLPPGVAMAADLGQTKPSLEFNYSNGEVGHHATGLSAEDAGDIQLDEDPLPAPVMQNTSDQKVKLETSKNLPEELNGREKQKGRQ